MAQIKSWLHYKFKYLSNDTSHAQFRVKMKKLWPQEVEEEKQAVEQKLCRDKANNKGRNFVATNLDYVTTKLEDKLCCDKSKDKLCCSKVLLC